MSKYQNIHYIKDGAGAVTFHINNVNRSSIIAAFDDEHRLLYAHTGALLPRVAVKRGHNVDLVVRDLIDSIRFYELVEGVFSW